MTRIAENQLSRSLLVDINKNREQVNRYSQEISSGYKVTDPGDSKFSGTVAQYRELLQRIQGHKTRIDAVQGSLNFQDNALQQAADLIVHAKEIATQGANETVGSEVRNQMAGEVFEMRNTLIALANSKYQGRYVFAGRDDNPADAPFGATTYATPATGPSSQRWVYDSDNANQSGRDVQVTDEVSLTVNVPGDDLFMRAIAGLERLGRALAGYDTTVDSAGLPTGAGAAFSLPTDAALQTQAIQDAMDALDTAREQDLVPAQVTLGAKQKRLDSAAALLDLTTADAEAVLTNLQYADVATAATNLSQAQSALEASFTVSTRMLNLSILDYL